MFLIYGGNKNQPVILFTRKYILQKGCEELKKEYGEKYHPNQNSEAS